MTDEGPYMVVRDVFVLVTYYAFEGGTLRGVYMTEEAAQRAAVWLEPQAESAFAHRVRVNGLPGLWVPFPSSDPRAIGLPVEPDGNAIELATFCAVCHGDPILKCTECGGMDNYPGFGPGLAPCTTCGAPGKAHTVHIWEGCRDCGKPIEAFGPGW